MTESPGSLHELSSCCHWRCLIGQVHAKEMSMIRAAQGASLGEQISCDIICGLTTSQLHCSHESNSLLPMVCQRFILYSSALLLQDMNLISKNIFPLFSVSLFCHWFGFPLCFTSSLCHRASQKFKARTKAEDVSVNIWLMEKHLPISCRCNPLLCCASSNTSPPHKHTFLFFATALGTDFLRVASNL